MNFAAPVDHARPRITGRESSVRAPEDDDDLRLALFGLVAGVFVSVIYVITEPMIIESKVARIKRLYSLASYSSTMAESVTRLMKC